MEMQGESRIEAPRDRVWAALNDPEVLKASIPGCEELEATEDGGFAAKVRAKVGPVSARFSGKVTLSNIDAPNGYRISGEGTGGAAGFAKGGATVALEPDGDAATLLRYDVQATVGGKLAQIGSRLIDGTARKMADDFFARFKAQVEGTGGTAAGTAGETAMANPGSDRPMQPPQQDQAVGSPRPVSEPLSEAITETVVEPNSNPLPPPRERPSESLAAEPPAHAGPTDSPMAIGALNDPVTAAAQPGAVDRAAATIKRADEAAAASPAGREHGQERAADADASSSSGSSSSSSSGMPSWVWMAVGAAVLIVLVIAFS